MLYNFLVYFFLVTILIAARHRFHNINLNNLNAFSKTLVQDPFSNTHKKLFPYFWFTRIILNFFCHFIVQSLSIINHFCNSLLSTLTFLNNFNIIIYTSLFNTFSRSYTQDYIKKHRFPERSPRNVKTTIYSSSWFILLQPVLTVQGGRAYLLPDLEDLYFNWASVQLTRRATHKLGQNVLPKIHLNLKRY